jgi:rhamnulokinase
MSNYYVACDFGVETGRVMLGTLDKQKLTISEVRRFQNLPIQEKGSIHWNIPELYQETMAGLTELSRYDEPIDSISCDSWAADYLLFESDGSLITPAYHHGDPRNETAMKQVFSKVAWETIYAETGVQKLAANTLYQLSAEKSRRLKRSQLMPIADAFNYLLTGVPRIELSLASTTQLYNPVTKAWSDELLHALRLPPELFPPLVTAGTKLGALRPDIAQATGLQDVRVVTSCSHEIAAALAGLPTKPGDDWAFLRLGRSSIIGTEVADPIITEVSRELNYTNALGYAGAVRFSKQIAGLSILEECRAFWQESDKDVDNDMLTHLAICSEPFESLINPADPRFLTPGDMPLKIQAFCKETNQAVPRKPGPMTRCILESLALLYRKTLQELEYLTGREIEQVYILGGTNTNLLNHFIANALQIPVIVVPEEATVIGNVMVQSLALGHIKSIEQGREIVRSSFPMETIVPHANAWDRAFERLAEFLNPEAPAAE